MFIAVIIFFISIWGDIVTILTGNILCIYEQYLSFTRPIRTNIYTLLAYSQIYCLLYIFFIRFHHVLKPTKFKFSLLTLKIYYSLFIFIGICAIIIFVSSIFTSILSNTLLYAMAALTMMFMLILIISIIILFTMKLMKIHRNKFDEGVISVVTKIIILTSITLTLTFANLVVISLRVLMFSPLTFILSWNVSIWDIFTNFLCMVLSYNMFNNYYLKLCGPCDTSCHHCLDKTEKEHAEYIENAANKRNKSKVSGTSEANNDDTTKTDGTGGKNSTSISIITTNVNTPSCDEQNDEPEIFVLGTGTGLSVIKTKSHSPVISPDSVPTPSIQMGNIDMPDMIQVQTNSFISNGTELESPSPRSPPDQNVRKLNWTVNDIVINEDYEMDEEPEPKMEMDMIESSDEDVP